MLTTFARSISPEEAREAARKILEEREFQPDGPASEPARPLKQPLTWLGERISDLFEPLGRLLNNTVGRGGVIGYLLFGILCVVLVVLLARAWTRRVRVKRAETEASEDLEALIVELTARAEQAQAAGRWHEATRLRFRIGLLRLEVGGALRKVDRKPNGAVTSELHSTTLTSLAELHNHIAYGRSPVADERSHDSVVAGMTTVYDQFRSPAPERTQT
jgi:hypothetical protein